MKCLYCEKDAERWVPSNIWRGQFVFREDFKEKGLQNSHIQLGACMCRICFVMERLEGRLPEGQKVFALADESTEGLVTREEFEAGAAE